MQRELPIAEIDGVEFYVDVKRDELWQVDCPENAILFSAFQAVDNGYIFRLYKKYNGYMATAFNVIDGTISISLY